MAVGQNAVHRFVMCLLVSSAAVFLATKRETWENETFKQSNDDLYVLLDKCVELIKEVRAHRSLVKNAGNRVIIDVGKTPVDNSN